MDTLAIGTIEVRGGVTLRAWAVAPTPPGGKMEHVIPVNAEDRRDAGFTLH